MRGKGRLVGKLGRRLDADDRPALVRQGELSDLQKGEAFLRRSSNVNSLFLQDQIATVRLQLVRGHFHDLLLDLFGGQLGGAAHAPQCLASGADRRMRSKVAVRGPHVHVVEIDA